MFTRSRPNFPAVWGPLRRFLPSGPGKKAFTGFTAGLLRIVSGSRPRADAAGRFTISPPLKPASIHVLVDISNRCNLRCIMCHFSNESVIRRKPRFMLPDLFERFAAETAPYAARLTLSAAYEPTTSPYFPEILGIASHHGFPRMDFLTNGSFMPESLAHRIVACGVSDVCFSVHAARKESYAHILKGGSLGVAIKNISRLIDARNRNGSKAPKVQFNVTLMRSNLQELDEIVDLAADLGADAIALRHVIVFEGLGMEAESLANCDRSFVNHRIQRALERAAHRRIVVTNSPDYFDLPEMDGGLPDIRWEPAMHRISRGVDSGDADGKNQVMGNIDSPPEEDPLWVGETLEISGWALSPAGIRRVRIQQAMGEPDGDDAGRGWADLGLARFHNGTRPDVMAAFPELPFNYRAGWTFRLNASFLQDRTRKDFRIYAVAEGGKGERRIIGSRRMHFRKGHRGTNRVHCPKPFDSIYIDVHGNCFPYPDCHTDQPLGSLAHQSISDIWRAKPFRKLRRGILAGNPPPMCVRCPFFLNRSVDCREFFQPYPDFSREDCR